MYIRVELALVIYHDVTLKTRATDGALNLGIKFPKIPNAG